MIIKVNQGQLEGVIKKSILTGQEFYGFLGIPYAKAPVGDLRFQPPQPIEKWNGILDAKNDGPSCIQPKFCSGEFEGSEDCLYLNVYAPKPIKNDAPKAVMFFIYGGAFLHGSGSSDLYSPDYLLNYDVILVTFNYRLNIFGFLNMGTTNNVGNCGLRDQCLALKWVNENIQQFGGDPNNITIFGESAGAISVYLHLISPLSKGMFNKAIMQSDVAYSSFRDATYPYNPGFVVAENLGCTEKDPEKVVEFLRKQPAVDLCREGAIIFHKIMTKEMEGSFANAFGPSPEIGKKEAFLPDTIQNLQKTATPVPLIAGFNSQEGKILFYEDVHNVIKKLKDDFTRVIERRPDIDEIQFRNICEKAKKFYLGDEPVSEETAEKIVDLFTDYMCRNFYESFDFITKSDNPVFVYEFTFYGKFNVIEPLLMKDGPTLKNGACHADELPYLFYTQRYLPGVKEFNEPELSVIKNMCSLWTNFAKNRDPTSNFTDLEWKPFTTEEPCFLRIDKNLKLLEEKLRGKEFEFWKKILY